MNKLTKSKLLYKQAIKYMPAGVNSPVRAFAAVGGSPVYFKKGKGSRLYDVDGNSYIDYVLSWGPLILGHDNPRVRKAVVGALSNGASFGAPTEGETEIAALIQKAFPGMEKLRLVNSGTEAVMSAIRLARAFTGRDDIVKFEGCYHGHSDSLLVKAGSGAATFGVPTSKGVPADFARHTLVLPFNNSERFKDLISRQHKNIAAVILEPVCGNMGVVVPDRKFLKTVRNVTRKYGILLIFDEVMTGFRFCFGGAQKIFGVGPDITCLGKIIGGGLPIGAYGASRKIMSEVAPLGAMYQAGTLSGNPAAVACGLKTLQILRTMDYNKINGLADSLCRGLSKEVRKRGADLRINSCGSMFTLFFTAGNVADYDGAVRSDVKLYSRFFNFMLGKGIYFAPSQFEANFISFAHRKKDIEYTVKTFGEFLNNL